MQRKTLKIIKYSQVGHHEYPEDTWEEQHIWEDDTDILSFMQAIFMQDFRNLLGPNYGRFFEIRFISFIRQNIIIEELETFYGQEREDNPPESFDSICLEFKTWSKTYARDREKIEREARAKAREDAELAKLAELKAELKVKYEPKGD